MPPDAPNPLDRPAEALAAALAAWCLEPPRWPGIWLPALPWDQWGFEQRDLARRLAAAVLAADGRPGPVTDVGGRP
jgi:hypothetical protein